MSDSREISLVVAAAENGVIGRGGELPWRLPADLARFKQITMGGALIMGRKTYESIGRPLPGRLSIVVTRQPEWSPGHKDVVVTHAIDAAIDAAPSERALFVIGGADVYRQALSVAGRVYLTRVHAEVAGDAVFPPLNRATWRRVEADRHPADERNEHAFTFEIWERRGD